jgi:CheY-like chemotaxis protein
MTRWHVDDLLGRYMERFPDVRMLRYPAIAEHDERYRRKGDPLFPELKPLDFLLERKKLLTQPSWESIYQQHPIVVGGGQFPIEKLKVLPFFDTSKITNSIRYWDKAASDTEDAAFTAGVLMHAMSDGSFVISHVARGQWTALEREQKIRVWTEADAAQFSNYEIYVEQEPGSGGKESAEATIRHLAGYSDHDPRQWRRHSSGSEGKNVQSFLHDQTTRRGNGSWSLVELRHCRQATCRIDRGRYTARGIHRIQSRSSANCSHKQGRSKHVSLLILVVDDEPDVEMLFRQQFRRDLRAGRFTMDFAQSGDGALQRIRDAAGASLILILSDINMPGMTGLELLPKAKALRPDVPVIMITAYGDNQTKRKVLEGGAEALLTKPIDFAALRSEIDTRVERAA